MSILFVFLRITIGFPLKDSMFSLMLNRYWQDSYLVKYRLGLIMLLSGIAVVVMFAV